LKVSNLVKLTQVAARGVRVNSVNPGVVPTQIFTSSGMDPAAASQYFQDSKVFIMKKIAGKWNRWLRRLLKCDTNKLRNSMVVTTTIPTTPRQQAYGKIYEDDLTV
jgi:hypothetical protein